MNTSIQNILEKQHIYAEFLHIRTVRDTLQMTYPQKVLETEPWFCHFQLVNRCLKKIKATIITNGYGIFHFQYIFCTTIDQCRKNQGNEERVTRKHYLKKQLLTRDLNVSFFVLFCPSVSVFSNQQTQLRFSAVSRVPSEMIFVYK